ncbi:dTMP kinase [Candidatus Woesebacteria bacterium]|nr:dTMP kinase [Candidatus Woesebacteria bacterium]
MTMQKGFIISFEGGEGAGKTTQIVRLRDHLVKEGFDVVVVREPGGTVISEQIREVVLSSKNIGMAYTAEVLLFQAARAQVYRELVLPSLEAKKIVLMDRTRDSSVVYQGMVRKFGVDTIEELNKISTKDTYPDLTFLLDVDPKLGVERQVQAGGANRFEMENLAFHQEVREAYLYLAKQNDHARWELVDANQTLEAVEEVIWKKVAEIIV